MANFDNALIALGKTKAVYTGDPPTTQAEYEANVTFLDGEIAPTWSEIEAQMAVEIVRQQRSVAYPPIGDQLDALWKGGAAAAEMLAKVQAVKAKYPKPTE